MKIMEYNIMSGRSNEEISTRNYDRSLEIIRAEDPDIVGLCEVGKQPSAQFPAYELEGEVAEYFGRKLGMYSYHGIAVYFSGYAYGVAILSKYPIRSARTVNVPSVTERKPGGYYEDRCLAICELDCPGGLTVIVSHFGCVNEERINAVDTLLSVLDEIKGPVIFMGDLNMTPGDANLERIYERLHEVSGNDRSSPLTFPSDDLKYKIDYIFMSPELEAKSYKNIQTRVSDHVPYVAEIEFKCS